MRRRAFKPQGDAGDEFGGGGGRRMPVWAAAFVVIGAALLYALFPSSQPRGASIGAGGVPAATSQGQGAPVRGDDGGIAEYFKKRRTDVWLEAMGVVDRLLADDENGSRHQRFIIRTPTDITVLIAHNIDVAPRVPVQPGHTVSFRGQYEWTPQGGAVHFTHAPKFGRGQGGWIEHLGIRYN